MSGGGGTGPRQQVLSDRYEIDSVLGQGGMAEVYLGRDKVLGRPVAVKVLGSQFARDRPFVVRFRREAQAAAALNHPNVVSVFDTGSDDGTHFIVMEYVQGKTLAQVLREGGRILPERAAEIAQAVAEALAFAHAAGIIHRDVKPGNIMLTPSGDVKVMDFGIARATTSETLTATATVLGTATYFSPEQAQGEPVDARSDIYSLGCVLYEMLTGHPPFAGETPVSVAYKHVKEEPVPPSSLNADIPADVDAIVMKCLAKNPANRYQTARELAQDLGRFVNGEPVVATPVLPFEATTQAMERPTRSTMVLPATTAADTSRRRRWVAVAVLLLLLAMLAVGLFFLAKALTSSGALIDVKDVRGKPLNVAEAILQQQGFSPRVGRHVASQYPKGTVAAYRPAKAAVGATITLDISNGNGTTTVPDVSCEPRAQAMQDLEAAGLKGKVVGNQLDPNCPAAGNVAKQDPAANTPAQSGSTVRLWLVPQPSPSPSPTTPSPSPTTPPTTTPPTTTPPPTTPPSPSPS